MRWRPCGQWFMNSSEKAAIDYFIANAGKNDPDSPIEGGSSDFCRPVTTAICSGTSPNIRPVTRLSSRWRPWDRIFCLAYIPYNDGVDLTAPGGDLYNSSLGTDNGGVLSTILSDPSVTYYDDERPAGVDR